MNPNTLALSPGSLEVVIDPSLPDRRDVKGVSLRFGVFRGGKLFVSPRNLTDLNDDVKTVGYEEWDIVTVADAISDDWVPWKVRAAIKEGQDEFKWSHRAMRGEHL